MPRPVVSAQLPQVEPVAVPSSFDPVQASAERKAPASVRDAGLSGPPATSPASCAENGSPSVRSQGPAAAEPPAQPLATVPVEPLHVAVGVVAGDREPGAEGRHPGGRETGGFGAHLADLVAGREPGEPETGDLRPGAEVGAAGGRGDEHAEGIAPRRGRRRHAGRDSDQDQPETGPAQRGRQETQWLDVDHFDPPGEWMRRDPDLLELSASENLRNAAGVRVAPQEAANGRGEESRSLVVR